VTNLFAPQHTTRSCQQLAYTLFAVSAFHAATAAVAAGAATLLAACWSSPEQQSVVLQQPDEVVCIELLSPSGVHDGVLPAGQVR
jgi:hypothetical protein